MYTLILKEPTASIPFNFIQGQYLNFGAQFIKNINTSFAQKIIKWWNKWHFVENERENMQEVLTLQ